MQPVIDYDNTRYDSLEIIRPLACQVFQEMFTLIRCYYLVYTCIEISHDTPLCTVL